MVSQMRDELFEKFALQFFSPRLVYEHYFTSQMRYYVIKTASSELALALGEIFLGSWLAFQLFLLSKRGPDRELIGYHYF